MSQKIPSTSLRIPTNRTSDSIWYQEPRTYANQFFLDHSFRSHLKKVTNPLKTANLGRVVYASLPKKNEVIQSIYVQGYETNGKPLVKFGNQNRKKCPIVNQYLPNFLSNVKSQWLGHSKIEKDYTIENQLKPMQIGKQASKLSFLPLLNNSIYCSVSFMRSSSFLSSSSWICNQLCLPLQRNRSIVPAIRQILQLVSKNSQVSGLRIVCAGRFRGIDRARQISYSYGQLKRQNFSQPVDYASRSVLTKTGLIGIKVWLTFKESSIK